VDVVGWAGWAKVTFQTQWDQLLCQKSYQWLPNNTIKQSRPSDNSHGQLGAASYQCYLIKASQALVVCF